MLLAQPKTAAFLQRIFPQITQLPKNRQGCSLRQMAAAMGQMAPEKLDQLDAMLAEL